MKRKELKFAALVLTGMVAVSGRSFSTHATQVTTVLPVAGVGLKLEEGTSVEELEQIVLDETESTVEINTSEQTPAAAATNEAVVEGAVLGAGGTAADADMNMQTDPGTDTNGDTAQTPDGALPQGGDTATGEQTNPDNGTENQNSGEDADASDENEEGAENSQDTGDTDDADDVQEPENTDDTEDTQESEDADDSEELEEDYGNLVIAQVNDWVNVRSGPNTDSEIVGKLYNDSVGEMIRVEGDWYYIASGTVTGYVKAEYCVTGTEAEAMVDEVSVKTAVINTTTLNLREEPSTDAVLLKQLPAGAVLDVTSTDYDGWVEVNVGGTIGYVSSEYVSVNVEFVSAESKEEEAQRLAKEREEAERREAEAAAAQQTQSAETVEAAAPAAESAPVVTASGSGSGTEVANYALQFVGNPYVYGGTSLTNGADCSGFVLAVYAQYGVSLPHSATADRSMGTEVGSLAEAQPGDLVCYSGHVGIYIGNGQIVHASTPRTGIKISDVNYKPIACIRRIFN